MFNVVAARLLGGVALVAFIGMPKNNLFKVGSPLKVTRVSAVISSNMDTLQKRLLSILTDHARVVSGLNALGKYDWARSAEYFFRAIAELVFDEAFEIADLSRKNNPIFDLKSATRLIQVTSQLDSQKILKTLAAKRASAAAAGPIYFFLIGDRPNYNKNTFADADFRVDQIWGTAELVDRICAKGIVGLKRACQIAEQYLTLDGDKQWLTEANLLHQIERLMEDIQVFRDEQNARSQADLVRTNDKGEYRRYLKVMRIFNNDMELQFRTLFAIHEAVIRNGYPLGSAQRHYHSLRVAFIDSKAGFNHIYPRVASTLKMKRLLGQLKQTQADIERVGCALSANQSLSQEAQKQIASLEFEMLFMSP